MPNGEIIHIGDKDNILIEIPMRDIDENSTVSVVAFSEEGVPLAPVKLKMASEVIALPNEADTWSGIWSVLLWVLIGLFGAGLVTGIVYVVHRNRNSG